jgi:Na+-translocating ferredoxin:NAD+ oxidoreductase subunit B
MNIIVAVVTLTGLGALFGVGLALAAKKFCVQVDPRLDKVYASLPGVNCGACGMAGCMGFAEALIEGKIAVERCVAAEEASREKIAAILGIKAQGKLKTVAVLCCHGGNKRAREKFSYTGLRQCAAANLLMAGPKACNYGCIGFGDCARACPFGAITMDEEGLPLVDEQRCTACGKCVAACPKKLFALLPVTKVYVVRCKSLDFGKKVMEACSAGCIACGKCQKSCPTQAIKVVDNLAVIDYKLCDNRGECFKVCSTKAVAKKEKGVWVNR